MENNHKVERGISVVLLSYNEEENLKILIPKIILSLKKINEKYEIIVVDTIEPTDDTEKVCAQFGAIYINQEDSGFGGAFRTGIKYASMDKFLILDSDGSHDPDSICDIYGKFCEGYDLVIGSRYVSGGITNDSISSRIMSRSLNYVFRLCLGIKAHDISTDFRMYRTELLKNVVLECSAYDVLQEVLIKIKLIKPDFKIGEIPIIFKKRMYGDSKRELIKFIISYIRTLFRLMILRFAKTPEKCEFIRNFILYVFFGVLGAIIDFVVFSFSTWLMDNRFPELSNIIGGICGLLFTFYTNTFLNFKKNKRIGSRFISYLCVCLTGLVLSTFMIHLVKNIKNIIYAKLFIMIIVSFIQFMLNKFITYREK